jgi:hypothetical protein
MTVKPPMCSLPSANGPSVVRTSPSFARTIVDALGSCSPPANTHEPAVWSSSVMASRSRMIGSSCSGGSVAPVGWYMASRYLGMSCLLGIGAFIPYTNAERSNRHVLLISP